MFQWERHDKREEVEKKEEIDVGDETFASVKSKEHPGPPSPLGLYKEQHRQNKLPVECVSIK